MSIENKAKRRVVTVKRVYQNLGVTVSAIGFALLLGGSSFCFSGSITERTILRDE
jgi:hypothetical protein